MLNNNVDLTNCDREPIHIPGSIQVHGTLLACDQNLRTVTRWAANFAEMLGLDADMLTIGMGVETLFGDDMAHDFRNALTTSVAASRPSLLFAVPLVDGRRFDISIHRSAHETILEFEPVAEVGDQPIDIVRTVIGRIGPTTTIENFVSRTARLIRATLGYDRVMVYRFDEDGSGQVISEAKSAHLESFMGQYFPATDIPQQARILYLKNTIRIISDSSGASVLIEPELDSTGEPLDLSHAHLRSVSPIHCEYLRNMGVGASMSISIIIDGALWGLVACHHYSPKVLSMSERVAVEMFGEFFSLNLDVIRQKRKIDLASAARQALDRLLQEAPHYDDVVKLLNGFLPKFQAMIPSDGIGLWMNGQWSSTGEIAPFHSIASLVTFINENAAGRVWSSHTLCEEHPEAKDYCEKVSGVLVIPLSQRPRDFLVFFRKEFEHTLNWAGNPNKSYETGPLGDRLTPRKSFAIWKETVKGQSRRWTESDLETADAIRSALVEVVLRHNELITEERGKADLRQRMLNEELNHRVKNILAVIKSLVGQSAHEGRSLEEHLGILRGRIEALAIAHDQIVRGDGGGFLRDLLMAELQPYASQASIAVEGPHVWINNTAFSVLALVFHELATNSAKYGALSRPSGTLDVRWIFADNACSVEWIERGGPPVNPPKRKGFGSLLISRSVPHDLGGEADLDFDVEGLRARFSVPAPHVALTPDAKTPQPDMPVVTTPEDDDGHEARAIELLLVEDQMLIAMDAEMMLAERGITQVSTVNSCVSALKALRNKKPDAALLDVNLGNETSLPVARELKTLGIPFVFATGYGDSSIIPDEFSDITIVRKPYSGDQLVKAIIALIK